jgi:hypothetical protein
MNVQVMQNSTVFCSKMKSFIDSQSILYQEAINVSGDINEKCTMVANVFLGLGKCFEQLSELNAMVKNER